MIEEQYIDKFERKSARFSKRKFRRKEKQRWKIKLKKILFAKYIENNS
jgi:hypothetical protein